MSTATDDARLETVDPRLEAAYRSVVSGIGTVYPGYRLTVPPYGGYRTRADQARCNSDGASSYNGQSSFSKHQTYPARALDFMVIDNANHLIGDGSHPAYTWCGERFESLGFVWGGRFRRLIRGVLLPHPDWDHVELSGPEPTIAEVGDGSEAFQALGGGQSTA